jgi:hypothetical protein
MINLFHGCIQKFCDSIIRNTRDIFLQTLLYF